MDNVVLGCRSAVEKTLAFSIPFYSKLTYRDLGLPGFPYKAAFDEDGNPHYHIRCERHGKKSLSAAMVSPARTVVMFEYVVAHGWKLKWGLTIAEYVMRDRQSDTQSFAINMDVDPAVAIPWIGFGWLIQAFLTQILSKCTHSATMRRHERGFWAYHASFCKI